MPVRKINQQALQAESKDYSSLAIPPEGPVDLFSSRRGFYCKAIFVNI
jgi:hypothetical protein